MYTKAKFFNTKAKFFNTKAKFLYTKAKLKQIKLDKDRGIFDNPKSVKSSSFCIHLVNVVLIINSNLPLHSGPEK